MNGRYVIYSFLRKKSIIKKIVISIIMLLVLINNSYANSKNIQTKSNNEVSQNQSSIFVFASEAKNEGVTEDSGMYNTTSMVTATGLNISARETPQTVSVITKQRMIDENLSSVNSVINSTTGMNVRQFDSDRFGFTSRGMGVNNILRDGVVTYYDTRFNYGDNLLDTDLLDRIEVVRGAAGLMVGPGNPSAAINLIRKRPTHDFRGELFFGAGSWNKWRTGLDLSGPLNESGNLRGRFVTSYQKANSFIDRNHNERYPFYGVIEADLTENTLLSIGVDYQHNLTRSGMFGGLPIFFSDGSKTNYKRSDSFAPDWASSKVQSFSTFTSLQHNFENGWNIKGTFTYDHNTIDQKVLWATGFPDRNTNIGMIPGSMTLIDGSRRQKNYDLQVNGDYRLFSRTHRVSFGFNHQQQNFQNDYFNATCMLKRNCAPLGDFTSTGWKYSEPEWSNTRNSGSKGRNEQTAGYAVTQISLADPLTLILGSRVTSWKTHGDNFNTPQNASYSDEFIPYGGLVYNITQDLSVYTSYTEIFNPENRRDRNNQLLAPVSGQNYEVGLKGVAFDYGIDYSISAFEIRQNNLPQADTIKLPDNSIAYYAIDGTKTRGFEAEISGQLTDNWRLYTGYTQFSAVAPSGTRINTNTPNKQLKLFTTYTLPGELRNLLIGGGISWQDKTWLTVPAPGKRSEQVEQGSFAIVNLMSRYQFTPDLSLSVNLNNVFDKTYYTQFGQYSQYYYGAPRNIEASLRYRF